MPVFVELTTDAFEEVLASQRASKQSSPSGRAGRSIVRRPARGLEVKEDTYAIFKLVRADGKDIPLIDSSHPDGQTTGGYANFMLQSVQEARMEKHQIVETFGESYIFFFGEAPRFIDCSAVILNSYDFNWEAEWWENYNKYLRGTKSVEIGARTYLFYDDNIVEGYIVMSQAVKTADAPLSVQMQFRMFVTNSSNVSFVGDPNFPVRSSTVLSTTEVFTDVGQVFDGEQPSRGLIAENLDEYVGRVDGITNFSSDPDENQLPSALTPTIRSMQEVEDLFRSSIQFLSCYGADINDPDAISGIGLSPNFSNSDGATFKPTVGASFSFGINTSEGLPSRQEFDRYKQDPIGSVYGRAQVDVFGGGTSGNKGEFNSKYTQGAADPLYGYPSDFADGPGYGQSGFGDFGGAGFGSGLSGGDPGFKNPADFTFAGVSDNSSAFERFLRPKPDPTSLSSGSGYGLGASSSGTSGGAAINIGGKPSPFAMAVVAGTLNSDGLARQDAAAISARQANERFGFSTSNPFGVSCPTPDTTGLSLSFP